MRSKFSELVAAGVAAFKHNPIAGETPSQCPICRTYNNLWGILTDTHMEAFADGYVVTGTLVADPQKWTNLMYASHIGGCKVSQSGYYSLSEFLCQAGLQPEITVINGQPAIRCVPCDDQDCPCADIKCTNCTTSESKFPQRLDVLGEVNECFDSMSLQEVADKMNRSSKVVGEKWHVSEGKIVGPALGKIFILEMKFDDGIKIEDEMLTELLDKEGLGELFLRHFGKYFSVDSDDKKWRTLLRKNRFNKIYVKNFDDLTPVQWLDAINDVINTIS